MVWIELSLATILSLRIEHYDPTPILYLFLDLVQMPLDTHFCQCSLSLACLNNMIIFCFLHLCYLCLTLTIIYLSYVSGEHDHRITFCATLSTCYGQNQFNSIQFNFGILGQSAGKCVVLLSSSMWLCSMNVNGQL